VITFVFREENGSIWLMRRSKAERITEKLQSDAPSIEALVQAEVGCRCLARMSDNKWYRAELLGQTRLFRTVRLVDFGSPGEAVELKKWWDKEKVEANLFKPFKEPAEVGNQFLVVRRDWIDGKVGAVFNMDMRRID
jgi:Tudor domain